MTRALFHWFGRRRILMIAGILLAFAFGGWLSRRICTHQCPRKTAVAAAKAQVREPVEVQLIDARADATRERDRIRTLVLEAQKQSSAKPKRDKFENTYDPLNGLGL